MDSSNILSHLDQLDDEIDDLGDSLAPMLKNALSDTTSKLPLLDRTKAFVLLTYAIESTLFCMYYTLHWALDLLADFVFYSLPSTQWCQSTRAPSLQGIDESEAVFRQDQGDRKPYRQARQPQH